MIDATSGRALVNKTPTEAKHLISTMVKNFEQYGMWACGIIAPNNHEVSELLTQQTDLTSLVKQLALGQGQQ